MITLTTEQHAELLGMQHAMNSMVFPDYLTRGFRWNLAVVMETAEAIDHHGWKWWKHQDPALEQLQMELVDIWHFILSDILVKHNGDITACTQYLLEQCELEADAILLPEGPTNIVGLSIVDKLTLFMGMATTGHLDIPLFANILYDCDMTWTSLHRTYIVKNTLNVFRQNHGYKTGEYIKIWNGEEDNVHATAIGIQLSGHNALSVERLTQELDKIYKRVQETQQ